MVAAGLAAGLLGGGAAGVILGSPGLVSAQGSTTTTAPANDMNSKRNSTDFTKRRQERIQSVLKPLVDKGTITQAQADEVAKVLLAAEPRGSRHGGWGLAPRVRGMEEAAKALGMTADELRAEVQQGKTLAAIAKEKGVEVQELIDAMVADAKKQLNKAVKDGELTKEQADKRAEGLTERLTEMVNNGFRRSHGPGDGRRAEGGFGRAHRWSSPQDDHGTSSDDGGS